jgi:hypothetical protein
MTRKGSKKSLLHLVLALGVLALASAAAAQDDARKLVADAVDALPKATFKAKIKLTTAEGVRELELDQKVINDVRHGYLEVTAPPDLRGIRHLFIEPKDGPPTQYLKLTGARSIVRVAEEVRSQPFLRSTFFIADLVEPHVDAYNYKMLDEGAEIGGRYCKRVESTPKKPEKEVYGKIIACIDPKDKLVVQREFFDRKGKPWKVWKVESFKQIDGLWTPMVQDMHNTQEKTESRIETVEITYNADLPDSIFTPDYLRRQ